MAQLAIVKQMSRQESRSSTGNCQAPFHDHTHVNRSCEHHTTGGQKFRLEIGSQLLNQLPNSFIVSWGKQAGGYLNHMWVLTYHPRIHPWDLGQKSDQQSPGDWARQGWEEGITEDLRKLEE